MSHDESERRRRAEALLRADGERATGARLAVLDVLDAAEGHLTVAELHRQVARTRPSTNLSTVYRTVERMTELGLVHVVSGSGESSYGLAVQNHHHAVCDGCGLVLEIDQGALAGLDSWARAGAGFRVRSVELRGRCRDCQERARTPAPAGDSHADVHVHQHDPAPATPTSQAPAGPGATRTVGG